MHGRDDGGRSVEGVEGGSLGAGVILGRKQGFQFLAETLPGGILVAASDRVREKGQGYGSKPAKAGNHPPFFLRGGPLLMLDGL